MFNEYIDIRETFGIGGGDGDEPIILTSGCFDLLHLGHIVFLQACKAMGGYVVVALNSDTSVKRLKGEHRPIIPEFERKQMLLALDCVDEVIVFVEDSPSEVIEAVQPDYFVKSTEYRGQDLPEFQTVIENGGEVLFVSTSDYIKNIHTSNIIQKIYKAEKKRREE